jgi:hypothetical protein
MTRVVDVKEDTRGARSRTLEENGGGKGLKTWRRSRSLIEEGIAGPLIWLRRPKSRSGSTTIDWGGYVSTDLPLWKITSQ